MKSYGVTSVFLLTLLMAGLSAGEAQVLRPSELCSDHNDRAIATFEDANLEVRVRDRLSVGARDDLTCGLVSGLTDLTARNAGIVSLEGIQNLTGLRRLDLPTNSINDISALAGLTNLEYLDLDYNSITDMGVLSGLTNLRFLRLGGNSITDIGVLSGLTNLTGLLLDGNPFTDLSPLSGLTNLEQLLVRGNSITDISALSGLTSLTNLRIHTNSITDISSLSGLTNLRGLSLQRNSITDISVLGGLTNLYDLSLWDNSITDISPLSGLTSLRFLRLHINSITDISALSGLASLTDLTLGSNSITDISALAELTSLTSLDLQRNPITDISALSGLTSLTGLNLRDNPDLSNIQPLLNNTGLRAGDAINLNSTSGSCADVAALEAKGVTVPSGCADAQRGEVRERGGSGDGILTVVLGGQTIMRVSPHWYWDDPFGSIRPVLRSADVAFTNFEAAVMDDDRCGLPDWYSPLIDGPELNERDRPGDNQNPIAAEASAMAFLSDLGFNLMSLANNHSWGLGACGVEATRAAAARYGIVHAGTGSSTEEATAPAYLDVDGVTVALLASVTNGNDREVVAGEVNGIWLGQQDDWDRNLAAVREAARNADVVIYYQHFQMSFPFMLRWGHGSVDSLERWQIDFARAVIDAGATVYIAHGQREFDGVEIYEGRPIFRQLGSLTGNATRGLLAELTLRDGAVESIEVLPVEISSTRGPYPLGPRSNAELATGSLALDILESFGRMSANYGTEVEIRGQRAVIQLSGRDR